MFYSNIGEDFGVQLLKELKKSKNNSMDYYNFLKNFKSSLERFCQKKDYIYESELIELEKKYSFKFYFLKDLDDSYLVDRIVKELNSTRGIEDYDYPIKNIENTDSSIFMSIDFDHYLFTGYNIIYDSMTVDFFIPESYRDIVIERYNNLRLSKNYPILKMFYNTFNNRIIEDNVNEKNDYIEKLLKECE